MLQVKHRSDTKRGVRFMATICLYQDTRHAASLTWMREILSIGYVTHRNDGIAELRINGFASVRRVLTQLQPYVQFKQAQVAAMLQACAILETTTVSKFSEQHLREVVDLIFLIKEHNYKSNQTLTKDTVLLRLGLTP